MIASAVLLVAPGFGSATTQVEECSGCRSNWGTANPPFAHTLICTDPATNEELSRATVQVTLLWVQHGSCNNVPAGDPPNQVLACLPVPEDDTCIIKATYNHWGTASYTTFQCEQADPGMPQVCDARPTVPTGTVRNYSLTCGETVHIVWGAKMLCLTEVYEFDVELDLNCSSCQGG